MPGGSATGTAEGRVGEQQRCAEICPPSWLPSCRSASPKKTGASERGWMEPKEELSANNVTTTLDSYLVSQRH